MDVYIPTMKRLANLFDIIPRWRVHKEFVSQINLVVSHQEYRETDTFVKKHRWTDSVSVLPLPHHVFGIGAIRNWIVTQAMHNGEHHILMADDDIYPHHSANFNYLDEYIGLSNILGIGCITSYHSLLLGSRKDMMAGDDLILAYSGYGFRLFALNVDTAVGIGNFDTHLDVSFEDAELMRNGLWNGLRWYLDPGLKANSLGKRFEAGGIEALTGSKQERDLRTQACYAYCYNKWPQYMAEPPRKRMSWKKMLNDCLPGWESL